MQLQVIKVQNQVKPSDIGTLEVKLTVIVRYVAYRGEHCAKLHKAGLCKHRFKWLQA